MHSRGDRLVDALTRRNLIPWSDFKQIYNFAVLENDGIVDDANVDQLVRRSDDLRVLDMLGFIEANFSYGVIPIRAMPPVLYTTLSRGQRTAVITGARLLGFDARLFETLEGSRISVSEAVNVTRFNAPRELHLSADDESEYANIAMKLDLRYRKTPAATIAANLCDLRLYLTTLEWAFSAPPSESLVFSTEDLVFRVPPGRPTSSLPASLLRHDDVVTRIPRFIWWNGSQGAFVDPDWGRWLAVAEHRRNIIAYDLAVEMLEVPRTCPLPFLHARAAALCSGVTPRYIRRPNTQDLIGITGVPEPVAEQIAETLGQSLQRRNKESYKQ